MPVYSNKNNEDTGSNKSTFLPPVVLGSFSQLPLGAY